MERFIWQCASILTPATLDFSSQWSEFAAARVALFTLFTLISVIALQWTPNAMTGGELLSGLSFQLPSAAIILVAVGAFGITGVGGDEIMAYNYWLLEKGYAAHTGPRPAETDGEAHDAWLKRARGWIRVMTTDAIAAMICYTLVTVLFYILGAAILHRSGWRVLCCIQFRMA